VSPSAWFSERISSTMWTDEIGPAGERLVVHHQLGSGGDAARERHAARHAPTGRPASWSRAPRKPTGVELHQATRPQELLGQGRSFAQGKAMFSNTDMSLNRPEFWNINPISRRSA